MTTESNSEQIAELKAEIDRLNNEVLSIKNKTGVIFLDEMEVLIMIFSVMRNHISSHNVDANSQMNDILDLLGRLLVKIREFNNLEDV